MDVKKILNSINRQNFDWFGLLFGLWVLCMAITIVTGGGAWAAITFVLSVPLGLYLIGKSVK